MLRRSWLALPLDILYVAAALALANVAAAGPEDPIAAHIRHGLDIKEESAKTSAVSAAPSNTLSQGIATGAGTAFASSCQAALWSWKEASESYGSQHLHLATTTIPGSLYATYTYTNFAAGVKATRVTTLCDGYTRAIGSASYVDLETSTISFSPYAVSTSVPSAFTTPMPCSIGPSDCAALWTSFASSTSASLVFENKSALEPPCQTATANKTISFETAACTDPNGSGPGVVGSQVRLLYWPVRTAETSDAYFCSSYDGNMVTPKYIPGTKTGSGPNTFVTGNITITSPAVAISFSGLHRIDGCGPTLDHTILTLAPAQLSSVRGARAAYGWYPFNMADLNWKCESPNGTFTIQDTNQTSNGAECYQDVAAQAYWGASPQVDYARGLNNTPGNSLTIVNNYRPYVIPDQKVGEGLLHSLWGTTATWWIDGIWDPPIALTEASNEAVPTYPGGGDSKTTTSSANEVLTTPAMPAHTTPTEIVPTALPDVKPTTSAGDEVSSESYAPGSPDHSSAQDLETKASSILQQPTGGPGHASNMPSGAGEGSTGDMSTTPREGSAPMMVSNEVYWKSQTLTIGGAPQTVDDQVVSAAKAGLVLDNESDSAAAKMTLSYSTLSSVATSSAATAATTQSAVSGTVGDGDGPHSSAGSTSETAGDADTSSRVSAPGESSTRAASVAQSSAERVRNLPWAILAIVLQLHMIY